MEGQSLKIAVKHVRFRSKERANPDTEEL